MLDHIGLSVSDYGKSKDFYSKALAPLGVSVVMEFPAEKVGAVSYAGFGDAGKPYFWIDSAALPSPKLHVAFHAGDRASVDAFYKAALACGGRDNGKPGLRPEYHARYYGAFILDPDGHNIEAVCHTAA